MALTPNFNKSLTEATPEEVHGLIDGTVQSVNPLFSEELTRANSLVKATRNEALIEAFRDTAALLMQGEYASGGGMGFSLRNNTGLAMQRMLNNGDMATFEREIASADDKQLVSSLKTLRAETKAHCIEQGIKVHSTNDKKAPEQKTASQAPAR